jgi:hypothetical protein
MQYKVRGLIESLRKAVPEKQTGGTESGFRGFDDLAQ